MALFFAFVGNLFDHLVEDRLTCGEHSPDIRQAKSAVVSEFDMLLKILHRIDGSILGNSFELRECLVKADTTVNLDHVNFFEGPT